VLDIACLPSANVKGDATGRQALTLWMAVPESAPGARITEAQMATLKCPRCDAEFPGGEGWAQSAVSTLIAAPAVRDMATQVRCPKCHHFFAGDDIRLLRSSWSSASNWGLAIVGIVVVLWLACHAFLV
jgi:uncharacterized C2H2 Zn-finger protein